MQRTLLDRLLSPAGFGLVLLLFLLPFASVSCQSGSSPVQSTFTGVDLVVGGAPEVTGLRSPQETEEAERGIHTAFGDQLDLEPLALLAALVILAGMAGALIKRRPARLAAGAGLALVALALLAGAQARVLGRLADAVRGMVDPGEPPPGVVETRYGFWLAVAVLGLLAAGHGAALIRPRHSAEVPVTTPPPDPDVAPDPAPAAPT